MNSRHYTGLNQEFKLRRVDTQNTEKINLTIFSPKSIMSTSEKETVIAEINQDLAEKKQYNN